MFGPDEVERGVARGEIEGGCAFERDIAIEADAAGEFRCNGDVFFGKVDAGDFAVAFGGEVASGASDSGADIKDAEAGSDGVSSLTRPLILPRGGRHR